MSPAQTRALLNAVAAALVAAAGGLAAANMPIVALALTSISTFLVGWANLGKPGDVPIKTLPADVQARISGRPPSVDVPLGDRLTPLTIPPGKERGQGPA
jgi:hypothetical protein